MKKMFLILFACVFFTTIKAENINSDKKAIVFDFGGVIVHPNKTLFFEFIKSIFQIDDAVLQNIREKFKNAKNAHTPESVFWKRTAEELHITLPEDWEMQYDAAVLRYLNESQEMRALVKSYKELGYRVALLSNVTAERAIFLRNQGFYEDFFPVLLSCEIGIEKPDPRAYQMMLTSIQVLPENCIFIDDKPVNIEAAKAQGIDAILFLSPQQVEEELRIRLNQNR